MKYTETKKHIREVRAGDTILHNGDMKTLGASNIKRGGFMGDTIWGDSYQSGHKLVVVLTSLKF